ncbi:unnamed protein product [Brugia timori]|uniref:RNA-directed RNA polymerase n=1 Tax=Brugia timori TaxID=42155 RepID=A0A0R3RD11_9BILA|nr:unnamed protein product [Brugia timori]
MLDIVDASSILLRFEMEGISVGDRWKALLPVVKSHLNGRFYSFYNDSSGDNNDRTRNFGKSICDAITFYYSGDYHKVVQTLAPIRHNVYNIGGSNAQVSLQYLQYNLAIYT